MSSLTPPRGVSPAPQPANLADILERVLDKGIVVAGDIRINLLDIELLTIRLRLVVASVDRAAELGLDWWRNDPWLSGQNGRLERRLARIEEAVGLPPGDDGEEEERAEQEAGSGSGA
jgi:hypothetical protein